ncbi:hypothetical protein MRX96_043773 [Rhipicephalus microplus]
MRAEQNLGYEFDLALHLAIAPRTRWYALNIAVARGSRVSRPDPGVAPAARDMMRRSYVASPPPHPPHSFISLGRASPLNPRFFPSLSTVKPNCSTSQRQVDGVEIGEWLEKRGF